MSRRALRLVVVIAMVVAVVPGQAAPALASVEGPNNAFFGDGAGASLNPAGGGIQNAFFGIAAGTADTTGQRNAFFGHSAGDSTNTGSNNAFFGHNAGEKNTSGGTNSFFGTDAGVNNVDGASNTFIGRLSGSSMTNEHANTFLGALANADPGVSSSTAVGHRARVSQSNSLVLGSTKDVGGASLSTNVGIGTPAPNAPLHVARTDGTLNSPSALVAEFKNDANTGDRTATIQIQNGNSLTAPWNVSVAGDGNVLGIPAESFYLERTSSGAEFRIVAVPGGTSNFISGSWANSVSDGVEGATISGGGWEPQTLPNSVGGSFGTIGGGYGNVASIGAVVAGGTNNDALGGSAAIGGGSTNEATGTASTVGGGFRNTASRSSSTVGGGSFNDVTDRDGTIAGGFDNQTGDNAGTADDRPYAFVGGGQLNKAQGTHSTVSGGNANNAAATAALVGGGASNDATDAHGTVAGGFDNQAGDNAGTTGDRPYATVGGGSLNRALGQFATIPGGSSNTASGTYSLAAGRLASALHQGSFVWADSTGSLSSSAANQFNVRASGGTRIFSGAATGVSLAPGGGSWGALSDRRAKFAFEKLDRDEVLRALASMDISKWSYKAQDSKVRHIGPMAQDFYAAFGVGEDDRHITTVDADGVSLASIQALYELVREENQDLRVRIAALERGGA